MALQNSRPHKFYWSSDFQQSLEIIQRHLHMSGGSEDSLQRIKPSPVSFPPDRTCRAVGVATGDFGLKENDEGDHHGFELFGLSETWYAETVSPRVVRVSSKGERKTSVIGHRSRGLQLHSPPRTGLPCYQVLGDANPIPGRHRPAL